MPTEISRDFFGRSADSVRNPKDIIVVVVVVDALLLRSEHYLLCNTCWRNALLASVYEYGRKALSLQPANMLQSQLESTQLNLKLA